jgi:hypothetical protein
LGKPKCVQIRFLDDQRNRRDERDRRVRASRVSTGRRFGSVQGRTCGGAAVNRSFAVGDPVDIVGPYAADNILVEMQHGSARIAEVCAEGYMVTLGATLPPDLQFGPFPDARLVLRKILAGTGVSRDYPAQPNCRS